MKITIHQPLYIPWLGFFHKAAISDVMVILDEVSFSRGDYINRNRLLGANGSDLLTVPISSFKLGTKISDVQVSGEAWRRDHILKIRNYYSKEKCFNEIYEPIEEVLIDKTCTSISQIDVKLLNVLMNYLGIETKLVLQSNIKVNGSGSELIESICNYFNASHYISGTQGINYLDLSKFGDGRTTLLFQEYAHPTYQQKGNTFVSNLSILDLAFRMGKESLNVLMSSNSKLLSTEEKLRIINE